MPYIVAEPCINCKHTDCVEVCPVDCFYEGPNFLVIHPDECIDCNACVPVCPVEAIFAGQAFLIFQTITGSCCSFIRLIVTSRFSTVFNATVFHHS